MARHSIRTPELEDAVLVRLEAGETLSAICRDEDMPARSGFLRWCEEDSTLMDKYTRARKMGWDAIAEDAVRISDDSSDDPNSRRVRIDTRKWLLGKLYPHVYGDKLAVTGADGGALQITMADQIKAARKAREDTPGGGSETD